MAACIALPRRGRREMTAVFLFLFSPLCSPLSLSVAGGSLSASDPSVIVHGVK